MKTLEELRKEAVEKAQSLELDDYVRECALAGYSDSSRINYYNKIVYDSENGKALSISATFGAGTNSASVWLEESGKRIECVYNCHNHGNSLQTFREGFWVTLIIEQGKAFKGERKAKELEENERKAEEGRKNFLPL